MKKEELPADVQQAEALWNVRVLVAVMLFVSTARWDVALMITWWVLHVVLEIVAERIKSRILTEREKQNDIQR